MTPLVIFIAVIVTSLFAGTLLSFPVYKISSVFTDLNFADAVILSTQISGLIASLIYIKYTDNLSLQSLGLCWPDKFLKRPVILSFTSGLIIILLLGVSFFLLGIYGLHSYREFGLLSISRLIIGAIGTGVLVAVFEEIIFRGALLQGLKKQTSAPTAIIVTSLFYACVHFIHFSSPCDQGAIVFNTALVQFLPVYINVLSFEHIDAFISLFVLGLLLGMVRVQQNSIIGCIGLHAGLVAGIKIFRYLAEYQTDNPYPSLVSQHDYRLGFMASSWLFLAALIYYFAVYRKTNVKGQV